MSISVKEVELLNKKIDKINVESTKIKTRQEMLQKRLEQEAKDYKERFGVDLLGSSIDETIKKFKEERKRVSDVVNKEYDLKLKVVKAIEEGDYSYAKSLLGIEDESESPSIEDINETPEDTVQPNEVTESKEDLHTEESFGFDSLDLDDDEDIEEDEDVEEVEEESKEEEENSIKPSDFLKSVGAVTGNSIKEVSEEIEPKKGKINISDLDLDEDDDEDINDDFGFGDILAGTKFEV